MIKRIALRFLMTAALALAGWMFYQDIARVALYTYFGLGALFFAAALIHDQPRLSWQWLYLIPGLLIWPYFFIDAYRKA